VIHVTRRPTDPEFELFKDWHLRACVARERLITEWNVQGCPTTWKAKIDEDLYREFRQVFLYDAFYRKCAYCESKIGHVSAVQVEHYRPKRCLSDDLGTVSHPGYFWLSYEWWNLLPTCNNCNTWHTDPISGQRNPGKATKFPIQGARVLGPSQDCDGWHFELAGERALLLNPYVDEPEAHIGFDANGLPFSKTPQGAATILLCDLKRESLRERRATQGEDAVFRMIFQLNEMAKKSEPIAADSKVPIVDPSAEYSLWLKCLLQERLAKMSTIARS
jgi:hypothetical protein